MPHFSRLTAFAAALALLKPTWAAYSLKDDYSGSNFFDMFSFFTDADPTHGYVDYVDQSSAQSAGLINNDGGQIFMGVDSKNVASGRGRQSVRLTSKATYNHALIILDLEHMPIGCGTWPAFWTVGPNWPNSGEIDIIEGVNLQTHNAMTLHTGPGCSISGSSNGNSNGAHAFSGTIATSNCDVNAAGQAQNAGCSISNSNTNSYGSGLNAINGGVYATEWTSEVIRVWYFPRSSIPADISTANPNPSTWGIPQAAFSSAACDIDTTFKNQQIVFDTTFCGDWAGSVWSTDATCSAKAATCQEYVQNNPTAFADAYWTINSLKVFTGDGSEGTNPAPTAWTSKPGISISSALPTGNKTATWMPSNSFAPSSSSWSPPPAAGSSAPSGNSPSFVPSVTSAPANRPSDDPDDSWTAEGGWHGRTWNWGGGSGAKYYQNRARGDDNNVGMPQETGVAGPIARSVPERRDGLMNGSEPKSLVKPMVRSLPRDVDEAVVRRHMAEHRRSRHIR